MASVGESVRKAIADWSIGETDFAMLHACNAVDGTARKRYPALGSNARFTKLLRESYEVLGPMGMPGVDLENTRWPVRVERPKANGGQPDVADVIYGIHRCSHGHGEELPDGFSLIRDAAGPIGVTRIAIEAGKLHLSDRIIFGLLAVAVVAPENVGQRVPEGFVLKFSNEVLPINQWWGRSSDFATMIARHPLPPKVLMDFNSWMPTLP